jgi:hypothetical protein
MGFKAVTAAYDSIALRDENWEIHKSDRLGRKTFQPEAVVCYCEG